MGRRRFAALAATVTILAFACWEAAIVLPAAAANPQAVGMDVAVYIERTQSWLAGTGFYLPRQLTGAPYVISGGDALYPPPAVLLFLPWAVGAPMVLWWLCPLALVAASIAWVRPPMTSWPILALILLYPRTWTVLVLGNPSMWAVAAVAAGAAWGWPAIGAILKPVFAPFALLGLRRPEHRRMTAIAALVAAGVALAFLPMWPNYFTALVNAQNTRGIEYTLGEIPIGLALAAGLWTTRLRARRVIPAMGLEAREIQGYPHAPSD